MNAVNAVPALSSRERVIRTLRRQPVDRFPLDLGCHFSTGISVFAYRALRERLGLDPGRIELVDPVQMLARVDDDVLDRLRIDTALLHPGFAAVRPWTPRSGCTVLAPTTLDPQPDGEGGWRVERDGQRLRLPAGGWYFDGGWPSFEERPPAAWADALAARADAIAARGRATLLMAGFSGFVEQDADWLMAAASEPERVQAAAERRLADMIARAGALIDRLGDRVQLVEVNADLGSQRAPLLSPRLFRAVAKPYLQRFCAFIHAHSDWKVFLHSCGAIAPLLEDLVEAGVDVLNPVQISATDMDPAALKARWGARLVFWGGACDTQRVLATATPAEVAAHVDGLCRILAPGGGFVATQVHNIQGDVPPENVIALYDAAHAAAVRIGGG